MKALPFLLGPLLIASSAFAQVPESTTSTAASAGDSVPLTLGEAIELALVKSYTLRQARQDLDLAEGQTKEAWGTIFPRLDASASYTRTVAAQNPFAGSGSGSAFSGIPWLINNELARTDPSLGLTEQTLTDYLANQPDSDGNPFLIDNQFRAGLTLNQIIYNGAAFAAVRSAHLLSEQADAGVNRESHAVINQVGKAYYGALLAREQVRVLDSSVERSTETVDDVRERVARGVAPQFDLLSSEVELANQEASLLEAKNASVNALDQLKFAIGMPPTQPIELRGEIPYRQALQVATMPESEAIVMALDNRPDLQQAQLAVDIREADEDITFADYLPELTGFLYAGVVGNVPDDRAIVDPLTLQPTGDSLGFFDSGYWFGDINLGLRLNWNLFNGFQTTGQLEQKSAETQRSRVRAEQLTDAIRVEVRTAIRGVRLALERVQTQERNIERAELSYDHAQSRAREGVSTQLELRNASNQLDRARLSYLSAMHDYLVAWIDFEVAVGIQPGTRPLIKNLEQPDEN